MLTGFQAASLTLIHRAVDPFVLLVDDDQPTLCHLRHVVENAGISCVATCSSTEALTLTESRRPSLVVTDLTMPELDGPGLGRCLKARFPSLPLILVTGELLDVPTISIYRRTFAAVLAKPLRVDEFLNLLEALMPRTQRGQG